MPMGQSANGSQSLLPEDDILTNDDELFGTEGGGYFHPYISIAEEYTDNLFNLNTNETSSFLTTISPGIWLALPSRKDIPLSIAPNNTSAAGLQAALDDYTTFDRMNIYLLGGLAYKMYSTESGLNDFDGRLEGLFKYNLRNGLSFQVVDSFNRNQDRFDIQNSSVEDKRRYYSNLAMADADWAFTEKLRAKVEYSNFYLDYDQKDDNWLNRTDNAVSVYGFYKYSLKTSLFMQYQYVDVAYDVNSLKDSDYNYLYGGFNWITTDKTALHFKLGYQKREYKNSDVNTAVKEYKNGNDTTWSLQTALDYYFTEKTKLIISLNHAIEETDSYDSLDKKVLTGNIHYEQEFKENFIGMCDFRYENADYTQFLREENRDDDRFMIRPALQYVMKDWLMAEVSYTYDMRNSTDDYFDYKTNIVSISLNGAL
ncbi:MAG: hypothetical protein DSY80_09945 [Desulfocapsa sp.]|nr:MAG: hypothetical protein DSY80_09945 [Desulfocapsa sp.]